MSQTVQDILTALAIWNALPLVGLTVLGLVGGLGWLLYRWGMRYLRADDKAAADRATPKEQP